MSVELAAHTVLVTGASSGIGRAFATALAEGGADVVLVARRADRLRELADQLMARHGVAATPVTADLTRPDSTTQLRSTLAEQGVRVTSLVNCAGFATWGPFAQEDLAEVEDEIAVDVSAPVRLAHTFLPDLRVAGDAFLINVASMAAYAPTPRMAVYGATKAFVLSFTESLWAEHRDTGLTVFAISPGATATEFNSVVGTEDATAGARMRQPEDVVATALRHLGRRNPGPSVIDGTGNRFASMSTRFASRRTVVKLMDRLTDPSRRLARSATANG